MKKLIFLILIAISITNCDNILNNLDTIENSEVIDPYTTGDNYTIIYSQNYNRAIYIQIKDGDRLLSEQLIGEFTDSSQTHKELKESIKLPKETKSYSFIEHYTNDIEKFTIVPANGSYIYITYTSSGLFINQSKIYKSTAKK